MTEQKELKGEDIPQMEAPDELFEQARPIFESICKTLQEENRLKKKYLYTIAIAANALYFYQMATKMAESEYNDLNDPVIFNRIVQAMNKAGGEYLKAAKSLLLTPESETPVSVEKDKEDDFFEMLHGQTKSGNENMATRNEATSRTREGKSKKIR